MSGGISNFQIEEAFKNINDSDINDNFVGVFPANQMTKFIDYKSMISEKRKMSLLDSKYWQLWQKVTHCGAYTILN